MRISMVLRVGLVHIFEDFFASKHLDNDWSLGFVFEKQETCDDDWILDFMY